MPCSFCRIIDTVKLYKILLFKRLTGIIVGPLVYYRDYIDFIDGNNILKQKVGQFKYNMLNKY